MVLRVRYLGNDGTSVALRIRNILEAVFNELLIEPSVSDLDLKTPRTPPASSPLLFLRAPVWAPRQWLYRCQLTLVMNSGKLSAWHS